MYDIYIISVSLNKVRANKNKLNILTGHIRYYFNKVFILINEYSKMIQHKYKKKITIYDSIRFIITNS